MLGGDLADRCSLADQHHLQVLAREMPVDQQLGASDTNISPSNADRATLVSKRGGYWPLTWAFADSRVAASMPLCHSRR